MIRQIQTVDLPLRSDKAGDGRYGAPRGKRTHNGIDYACIPNEPVLSPVSGVVTKLGHTYGDDLLWRYVQVTDGEMIKHRVFYVNPTVKVGQTVSRESIIGQAQDISLRYPDTEKQMTPHVHYEVVNSGGDYIDPSSLITV